MEVRQQVPSSADCSDQGPTNNLSFITMLSVCLCICFQKKMEKKSLDTEVPCFFCLVILSVCIKSALIESLNEGNSAFASVFIIL